MFPTVAMIVVSAIASSSTGGNIAGPGVVVHTGDAYSSVNVVNVMNGGQGTSTVDIETNANGERHTQHIVEPIGDGAVHVVATSSGTAGASVHISIKGGGRASSTILVSVAGSSSTSISIPSRATSWIAHVFSRFFDGFRGFFGW